MDQKREKVRNCVIPHYHDIAPKKDGCCPSEDEVKKLCIFRNRVVSSDESSEIDQKVIEKIPPCEESSAIQIQKNCHSSIIKALTELRTATHKNFCHVSKASIPIRYKLYLMSKFSMFIHEVNKYSEQLTNGAIVGKKAAKKHLYAKLYMLEAQYNLYLQRYIDVLSEKKQRFYNTFFNC